MLAFTDKTINQKYIFISATLP